MSGSVCLCVSVSVCVWLGVCVSVCVAGCVCVCVCVSLCVFEVCADEICLSCELYLCTISYK